MEPGLAVCDDPLMSDDSAATADPGPPKSPSDGAPTAELGYADRLNRLQGKRWKQLLHVQLPYQLNIRRYALGRTLDVGCGNGRNLGALSKESIGVDHNPHLVASARERGLPAHTTTDFFADPELSRPGSYDSILAAHLIEHLTEDEARTVLRMYLPQVRPGGRVLFITPQERGYASDPTHVVFTDFAALRRLAADLGLRPAGQRSFPFPRWAGKLFIYNEFNLIAEVPSG